MLWKDEINKAMLHPGRLYKLRWSRVMKDEIKAEYSWDIAIRKVTTAVVRLNITNDNRKEVIAARKDGTLPEVNQGLNGMEWVPGYEKVLLRSLKTSEIYLRICPATNMGHVPHVGYFFDGSTKEEKWEDIEKYFKGKYVKKELEPTDCYSIRLDYIVEFNSY